MEQINTLEKADLRKKIRNKERPITCWKCSVHKATDVHHLNGHHWDDSPENLAARCKLCHDESHGITAELNDLALVVRQFYALQEMRMGLDNRVRAYRNYGYEANRAGAVAEAIGKLEKSIEKVIAEVVKSERIYQGWLKHVKGIGPTLSAAIITRIGAVDRFETVSSLWAYGGLDVRDGRARKRQRGEKANWDPELRTLIAFKVPNQFIKATNSFGRHLYDQYKTFYEEVHDGRCPVWSHPNAKVNKSGTKATVNGKGCSRKGHINNMAKRKVGKVFLACLWAAWRKLQGLPTHEPYATTLENHTHLITPKDWLQS